MKNELGIEVKCESCQHRIGCWRYNYKYEKLEPCDDFYPTDSDMVNRIKELQLEVKRLKEQKVEYKKIIEEIKERYDKRFSKTQECNNTILEIAKSKTQECNNWFNTHQNKKKIEQTLKNLEGNLINEQ